MPELFEIPITATEPSFKIRTIIEDIELVLRFDWNGRDARWQLSILTATEVPLLMGLPLNINTELLERFEVPGIPAGRLLLYDTRGGTAEAGRNDLGDRCRLFYVIP